jgi:hypothetical protein
VIHAAPGHLGILRNTSSFTAFSLSFLALVEPPPTTLALHEAPLADKEAANEVTIFLARSVEVGKIF